MNGKQPRVAWTALAVAAALLTACSETPAPPASPKPVFVTTLRPAPALDARSFTATVRARVESDLGFRAGGKVIERLVDVGDTVRAGQPLARLDAEDYRLAVSAAADQVRAAAVDADQAAADEARFRRLAAEGSAATADHERQKARADAAAARLDQARRQLELARNRDGYTTLVAPFTGVVTALRLEVGQVVGEGQPVLSMAREGEREIVADLPEEWVAKVRTLTATARPWQGSAAPMPLRLREVAPLASAQGRTFRVRFAATAESRAQLAQLPLGSTAQLQVVGPTPGTAIAALPVSAVVKDRGSAGVWAVDAAGTGLVFTPVQVLAMDDATVRVTGLAGGLRVVTVGAQKLDAGMRVRAIERPLDTASDLMARSGS
jgi:RND family efflux transporter MFP subunit